MDRLCDEILQLILNELDDPGHFSLLSKKHYTFTQDPYVRSSYFISRYGKIQALYWALGRGRLMNNQVIDTLLSSGAHLSRYFVQCAIHHYYRSAPVPFIKTPWVRSMDMSVFTHFQVVAVQRFGSIPLAKGENDGTLVDGVIKDSRFPIEQRQNKWEMLKEILETYKFIPFCHKDAMMANFPLVLALEPRLLPYAQANGFTMDHKYRNFVFRKMFEKPAIGFEGRADEIVRNVQELSRLDPRMFLSRTVAAEICMEVKSNEQAYNALKRLDKEGFLRFELSTVVETLIKTFANTRSITTASTFAILRHLFQDFPSNDPTVRLVLLLQVFLSETPITTLHLASETYSYRVFADKCRDKIESIGLPPVERADLLAVLSNQFAPERFFPIVAYGRLILGMSSRAIDSLLQDVAFRCLEIACKGKMLKRLVETHPFLADAIRLRVMQKYRINVEDLPSWETSDMHAVYVAPLCQEYIAISHHPYFHIAMGPSLSVHTFLVQPLAANSNPGEVDAAETAADEATEVLSKFEDQEEEDDLGLVGQDTLSAMIRKDESAPNRRGRRGWDHFAFIDTGNKYAYPADASHVGKWIAAHYGPRSGVTATFMVHAVINNTASMLQPGVLWQQETRVPITLKMFKILARLGRAPPYNLFDEIEMGTEFYFSEEDYLSPEELSGTITTFRPKPSKRRFSRIKVKIVPEYSAKVKSESSPTPSVGASAGPSSASAPVLPGSSSASASASRGRPRRSAASSSISYVVPDSDDDMIADDTDDVVKEHKVFAKKRKVESNLQKWIKNLTILLKEEQKKYKESKKQIQALTPPGKKVRVAKNEFYKALALNLTRLRRTDKEKRRQLYGIDIPDEDYSSGDEDEYQERTTRSAKRRKIEY